MTNSSNPKLLAQEVRKRCNSSLTGPCDLDGLLRSLHLGLRLVPLHGLHGLLTEQDGRFTVVVNSEDAAARQRFTIAHEASHFLLGHTNNSSPLERSPKAAKADARTERECDNLAAEILMPSSGYGALILGRRPGISLILEMAARYQVSVESSALRFAALTEVKCQVSKWQFKDDTFVCRWAAGSAKLIARGESFAAGFRTYGIREAYRGEETVLNQEEVGSGRDPLQAAAESRGFGPRKWRYVLCTMTPVDVGQKKGART